ncbi:CXC domain-containing protein [Nephila pilipes]|uniref:CXC domain-containing protein n=1 Tax=Nephila pilipes TaxID=299642 RepID=A0A8X6Q6Z0_NEPPI|nr:CXC domain-containing protein [Nephila pilipes]
METEEIIHPEVILDSEEVSKLQNYNAYCPDFSDMRDDSYGFWDFISSNKDVNKNSKEKSDEAYQHKNKFWDFLSNKNDVNKNTKENSDENYQQKNKFWDFLGPTVDDKFQNIAKLSDYKKTDSIVSSPDDSGIYVDDVITDSKPQMYPEIGTISNSITTIAENCSNIPDIKSHSLDDDFWDFLYCNPPILNFQDVIQSCSSVSVDRDTEDGSHFAASKASPFLSDSNCLESGRCSTMSSTSSYIPSNTETYESVNSKCKSNTALMDGRQIPSTECRNTFGSNFDFTSYDDVLDYLKQDISVTNKEAEWLSAENASTMRMNNELKLIYGEEETQKIDVENWHSAFSTVLAQLNDLPTKENEVLQNSLNSDTNKLNAIEEKISGIRESNPVTLPSNVLSQNVDSSLPLFRNANKKLNSNNDLPCITSVFSIKPCPNVLEKQGSSAVTEPCKISVQKTEKAHHALNKKQYRRVKSGNFSKRPNQNGSLHINKISNSINTISNSNASTSVFQNFEVQKRQKQLLSFKPLQGPSDVLQCGKASFTAGTTSVNFNANSTVTQSSTSSAPVMANNPPNSAPLYLILPPNSASLQNPNYSHFFVILNNNVQPHQSAGAHSSEVASNLNSVKNTSQAISTNFSGNLSEKINEYDILQKQNSSQAGQMNTSQVSIPVSVENATSANIKCTSVSNLNIEHSSHSNIVKGDNNQTHIQTLKTLNNPINYPNSSLHSLTMPLSSAKISSANLNLPTSSSNTDISASKAESQSNLKIDPKFKIPYSKTKQVFSKPIKNISLGKDKYAIQQISVPMKIESIYNENDKDLLDPQESHINFTFTNERSLCSNEPLKSNSKQDLFSNTSESIINNISNSVNLNVVNLATLNSVEQNAHNSNANLAPKSVTSELNLKSSTTLNINNTNSVVTTQNPLTTNTRPINFNVVPVSEALQNRNTTVTNANKLVQSNSNQNPSISNLEKSNNYVQIKVTTSQNKSFATLKELFPPPISMVPVCIMDPTPNTNQATSSKVIILKGPGQQKGIPQKVQLTHLDSKQRLSYKKMNAKFKKTGPKTVRQLLQERKQNLPKLSCDDHKERKEIKVLKPILKLPVCTSISSATSAHTSTLNVASNSSSVLGSSSKRPNILLLPSSLKPAKKMTTLNDRPSMLMKADEPELSDHFSTFENTEEHLSPYLSSNLNKKDCRPRHYDMSELQIGFFKVSDDIDSCGRFRSKFKVIFNKRQFLYDFPVSRCNQMSLKSTHVWEQMARIVVPFKTIVSMKLRERAIQVNINTPPLICLGRLQARSGIIANATIYDTTVENDSSWGSIIRSSFHHKIILRKRQANKLRSFLCHFDDRFITLTSLGICETGFGNASEVSIFEGELSPNSLKKGFLKNKKSRIRRLPHWDSSENEEQKDSNEGEILLSNQMCSCRISCRSVRCSCVKGAKSCSSICDCISCDNPLNILETLGLNLEFSLRDSCLFQNIYPIPKLIPFLSKEVKLSCCNTFARVQDCIPGTVLCPNVDCNVPLEFSWCRKVVCYPERNPRNHCSFCGQCCFSNGRHCYTCNKCYVVSPKFPYCPTCRDKPSTSSMNEFQNKECRFELQENKEIKKATNKSCQKPEIILLDAYSIPKNSSSGSEDRDELLSYQDSLDCLIDLEE